MYVHAVFFHWSVFRLLDTFLRLNLVRVNIKTRLLFILSALSGLIAILSKDAPLNKLGRYKIRSGYILLEVAKAVYCTFLSLLLLQTRHVLSNSSKATSRYLQKCQSLADQNITSLKVV